MDNNIRNDPVMDLDLNQEPIDPSSGSAVGFGSLLNELETAHGRIEERIRQLEAVTARARLRQMWRLQARNPPEPSILSNLSETIVSTAMNNIVQNVENIVSSNEGIVDGPKNHQRDSTHLVAKALELDTDAKKVSGDGGGFFDCNICLDMAREPILTCCGHLFCWPCFYQLPCVYSAAKECPVCKGAVKDTSITPIYGNGNTTNASETESGLKVPPRPRAHRVESIRQQRVNRGIPPIPVAEALRRIRMGIGIGATGDLGPQRQDLNSVAIRPASEVLPDVRSRQISRVLSENADSLLSISTALNNAERLVDDLESYIRNRVLGRSLGHVQSFGVGDPLTSTAAVDTTAAIAHHAAVTLSSESIVHVSVSDAAPAMIDLTEPSPSPPSRGRIRVSRVSDVENGTSRESRRRRLN